MDLHYVTDEKGRKIAVIIPIEDWYEIVGNQDESGDSEDDLTESGTTSKSSRSSEIFIV